MSDIPRARARLVKLLHFDGIPPFVRKEITAVIKLLDREKPEFKVNHDCNPVTREQAAQIKLLRAQGHSLRQIAAITKQNSGRVSEVINGKRKGI